MPVKKPNNGNGGKRIDAVRHKDKRKNIPTEELRDFVREDENAPKKVLYPRDPDLDPQLVWKGKDEQDAAPLEVPAVPIYIQEKIHPQAIIEDFKAQLAAAKPAEPQQLNMFSDFNGLPAEFADRVDFYHHEGNWSNRLILGDSLLVMTSLAEKEALKGRVQMIYLDPPYGIEFRSNWQVSTRKREVKDGKLSDLCRQPEQVKAFRDTWKLGIHSYLAYLRDRLVVARDLLTDTGSIFMQIGDENVHLVRGIMDEVFGRNNFLVSIIIRKKSVTSVTDPINDYLLWYAKDSESVRVRRISEPKSPFDEDSRLRFVQFPDGEIRRVADCSQDELRSSDIRFFTDDYPLVSQDESEGRTVPFVFRGRTLVPGKGRHWTYDPNQGMPRLGFAGRLRAAENTARGIVYFDDFARSPIPNIWDFHGERDPIYVVQTNRGIVERAILMTTDPGDLVLDPTCGSGTTAYAAEQWGRRWITIDSSRVALTLARTRLMAGRFKYYYLADDYPKAGQLVTDDEIKDHLRKNEPVAGSAADVRKGFVYKRVPHVTLKAIANNEEIDSIHAKWQAELEPLLKDLNKAFKKKWQEWEVPRVPEGAEGWKELGVKAADEGGKLLKQWWELRSKRQAEIDASIARKADTEILYDQPYEDNKRVRVTGPFTVESLSPHRTISVETKKELAEKPSDHGFTTKMLAGSSFANLVLDNLRTAGVQNTIRNERLKFDSLQVYPGQWISGVGEYTEKDPSTKLGAGGKRRRAAICIGPEHGTVGPELVKLAAMEAVQGVGFDVLIVCGFAFDPHVSEEAKRYGKLVVLPTRMNPDLAMGDLLKKTGSANLFMVFGEPDVEVKKAKDGKLTAEIKGLDVYDPTTGEIRSSSTDDIACWFIDTNYNGESFFVRHAYFTGADEPYEKLKRALRAEVDESAWSALYSTVSRPFDKPATGKIAVKVINHYGDEVLKVYEMGR
jgi:adenine-specific DNA-methyltransferase